MGAIDNIPQPPSKDQPHTARLLWVVDTATSVVEGIVRGEVDDIALMDSDLRDGYERGIEEYVENSLSDARSSVSEARFSGNPADHGLTGEQLDVKVNAIAFSLNNFRNARLPKWLKKLLAYLNIVLDSLSSLVPTVGALAELKSGVEWSLDYRGSEDQA